MREFIYYSKSATTSGNFHDLMKAGRLDIAIHVIIMSFFVSNAKRENIKLNLFFYGPPDAPKHLEIYSEHEGQESSISKKDVSGLIKRMLYKYKKGIRHMALPGCYIQKKGIVDYVEELKEQGREVYLLEANGEDIRTIEIGENPVFIFGDQDGIERREKKDLKKIAKKVSLGSVMYFASQSLTILQNELDRREIL